VQEKSPARDMHFPPVMPEQMHDQNSNDQKSYDQSVIDALTSRAAEDARMFREQHPDETPSDRWIENSYTAALPLAKDSVGADLGHGPHPQLFDAYRREIEALLGRRADKRDSGAEVTQQPTPGEN
jgi:hypothetical protein